MGAATRGVDELRLEVRRLRREVYLLTEAIGAGAVRRHRIMEEVLVAKARIPWAAHEAIERLVGHELPTLQDLELYTRGEVASAPGVGPQTMEKLDSAMAEHGLSWVTPTAHLALAEPVAA